MNKVFLSVIIPSYNEISNLKRGVLDDIKSYFEKNNSRFSYEILIVDDGSSDGSSDFVKKFSGKNKNFKLMENPHLGKAGAVTSGILASNGDYVLFTDMDQATPIKEIEKLYPFFEKGFDVVIGSRSGKRKGAPLSRIVMARGMMILRSILLGISDIKDTQCGFKIFSKKAAKEIFSRISKLHNGFSKIQGSSVAAGFDIELLYIAKILGFKIKEVPVEWKYIETERVSAVKDSIEGLLDLLKIKINILKGVYKNNIYK